jgi:hypothetical protein
VSLVGGKEAIATGKECGDSCSIFENCLKYGLIRVNSSPSAALAELLGFG